MKEKYESLKLADLKEIAKSAGIKGATSMKKSELVEALCELESSKAPKESPKAAQEKTVAPKKTVKERHVEK